MPDGFSPPVVQTLWTPTPTPQRNSETGRSLDALVEICAGFLGVKFQLIFVAQGGADIEAARRAIAWLAYCHPFDTPEIGACLGCSPAAAAAMIAHVDRLVAGDPAVADRMIGLAAHLARAP